MAKKPDATEIEGGADFQPRPPLPAIKVSPIPVVEKTPVAESGFDACKIPDDENFTDGLYEKDGEAYALCIHTADGYGNTHTLKNTLHTWQGTKEQFNAAFTRV
jgi:hypothetical protein